MFHGFGPATELMQIYSLTEGCECEDCDFNFIADSLYFYLDLEHGQIIDALFVMLSSKIDSPIKGWVHKTYCSNCNKYVYKYSIEELNGDYDMEAAYYLTRILLPRKVDFISKRLEIYESITEKIKANDLDDLEKDLRIRRKYYEDLIPKLEHSDFNDLVNDDDEFDIDNYVEVYKLELNRLKNTVYSIDIGDETFNFTLDGEKIAKDICPNCKNDLKEFEDHTFDSCPKCGGKHMLFRLGADYD